LIIAPRARRDIEGLLTFTERQWGRDQRFRYRGRIEQAFLELMNFPDLGRTRADLDPELRAHQVGEHIIYYKHDDNVITVFRILHRRMDPERRLPTP
jgi:toxin ParE1/3/4